MFNKLSLIGLYVVLIMIGGLNAYGLFFKPEKPLKYKVVETEVSRIDTVYTSPPSAVKFDFGTIDTTWKGADTGVVVVARHIYSEADYSLVIACIDGYQYYVVTKADDSGITPRVINGPNGMMAMPCQISKTYNPYPQ